MNQYEDLAESAAFLAGRDAARDLVSTGAGPGDTQLYMPRGLHGDDEISWIRGWRSWFA